MDQGVLRVPHLTLAGPLRTGSAPPRLPLLQGALLSLWVVLPRSLGLFLLLLNPSVLFF